MTNNSIVCLLHTSYLFIVSDNIKYFCSMFCEGRWNRRTSILLSWHGPQFCTVLLKLWFFLRSRGEYVQYARGNSSTLWSKRVMGGEATEPSKPEQILNSEIFGFWLRWTSFMWRLVTSLKRAGDSKLIHTCDNYLSCLQVGRVTATEKRDPHVALKAHFSLPNSLSVNLPFGFPDARVNVSGCWFWEGQWEDQAWRGRDARFRFVSWISESRFWAHWIHRWSRSVVYGCWLKFVGIVCTSENSAEECYWKDQTIRRTRNRKRRGEFLSNNNIIDYSLLLGIHEKDGKDGKIWEGEQRGVACESC